jgi:4-amino-4-deoxy-L-arabinose transferase-like glycosyltransferase
MSRRRLTLIALIVFFAAGTTLWIALNRAPPQWDDSWYLTNSLVLFDALSDGLPAYIAKYLTLLRTKPPLIAVLPTPFYLVLGRRVHAAYLVNVAILPAFFCLVYLVGRRLRNARTGLLAVYICATMPLLYGLSHWFLVEYSLAALVCLTVFLACLAVDRPDWRICGCLGITCGLGVLLKISFPVYVLPVLLYVCVRLWRNSGWSWRTVSAFLIPAVLLPLPWYAVNYRQALGRAVFSGFSQTAAKLYGTPIKTYLLTVVTAGTSTYYILLFVALLLLLALTRNMEAWWRRWANDGRLIVALWLLPFLVFLFGRNKDLRFIAPILPAVALIIASLLDRWPPALTALALTFPLLACLHASFGVIGGMAFATHNLHFAKILRSTELAARPDSSPDCRP